MRIDSNWKHWSKILKSFLSCLQFLSLWLLLIRLFWDNFYCFQSWILIIFLVTISMGWCLNPKHKHYENFASGLKKQPVKSLMLNWIISYCIPSLFLEMKHNLLLLNCIVRQIGFLSQKMSQHHAPWKSIESNIFQNLSCESLPPILLPFPQKTILDESIYCNVNDSWFD